MTTRNSIVALGVAALWGIMGCGHSGDSSGEGGGGHRTPHIGYAIELGPDSPQGFADLDVDFGRSEAKEVGGDGVVVRLPLTPVELDDVFALFSEELSSIYWNDSLRNDPSLAGNGPVPDPLPIPVCNDQEDSETIRICRALELAAIQVSGRFDPGSQVAATDGEAEYGTSFTLVAPAMLSIETADMLLALEELRLRVHLEGTL